MPFTVAPVAHTGASCEPLSSDVGRPVPRQPANVTPSRTKQALRPRSGYPRRPMLRTPLIVAAIPLAVLLDIAACSGTTMIGSDACGTCASVYVNGGIVCGPGDSDDAWRML